MAERIESIWDRVGRGESWMVASERVVRDVIRDFNKSHDEMLHPKRSRRCNLGKWYREKKSEMSTLDGLTSHNTNDSTLLDRVPSSLVIMEEMTELRSSALVPWK